MLINNGGAIYGGCIAEEARYPDGITAALFLLQIYCTSYAEKYQGSTIKKSYNFSRGERGFFVQYNEVPRYKKSVTIAAENATDPRQ